MLHGIVRSHRHGKIAKYVGASLQSSAVGMRGHHHEQQYVVVSPQSRKTYRNAREVLYPEVSELAANMCTRLFNLAERGSHVMRQFARTVTTFGEYTSLSQLGGATKTPSSPFEAVLERVPNAHKDVPYVARFVCPEFTSLCPVTGQPDFAHLVIDYIPKEWLVESKSLKLYLTSFRNHGDFHEACTVGIGKRLVKELDPVWLRIGGYWYPRGGIPIDVFFSHGSPPKNVWIPDQACEPYRGRG